MENGIIFNIKKFAIHDGPGIRTTIFFKGCPLNCKWCHNPEGIKSGIEIINNKKTYKKKIIGFKINITDLMDIILKDQIFYQQSNGGVTFSGGEPFYQLDFLKSVLIECKKNNIHTTLDTCGYTTINEIDKIYDFVDLFLYDIKIIDEKKHIENTGRSNREILKNLEYLMNKGDKVIIRIPLIPEVTDTKKNLTSIKKIIDNFKNIKEIYILPYNKLSESKSRLYKENNNFKKYFPQTNKKLEEIKSILKSEKYKIKIGG